MTTDIQNSMSRNIFLKFDEWTEIRKELGIKRKRCKFSHQMEDEYWNFRLSPYRLSEWKKEIKKGWDYGYCFERTGVHSDTLKKLKSQHLINRLCQEEWRVHDLYNLPVFELDHEYHFHSFLGWIYNANLKEELDIYTSRDKLYRIWEIMSKKIKLDSETRWFQWNLESLANEVIVSVCKQTLEA